jgi:YegS/Rv2252/BmrU family lipid kinase
MKKNPKNLLIINPNAGKGLGYRMAYQIEAMFKSHGWEFSTRFTYGVKHAIHLARQAVADGYKTLVAVGGDGTINEVTNGIAEVKNIHFGVVAIGTGNDYIKAVGIPSDPEKAVEVVIKNKIRKVDIGKVENQYFVNGLGIGFDAQVAEDLYKIKKLRGFSAYLYAVVKNLFFFPNPEIEIAFNGKLIKGKSMMVSVMIGNYLGGGFYLTPDASVDDGMFDILSLGDFNLMQRFFHLPKMTKGTHLKVKGVNIYRTDNVTISSESGLKVHVDGEMININTDRFDVKLLKKKLNLIVP